LHHCNNSSPESHHRSIQSLFAAVRIFSHLDLKVFQHRRHSLFESFKHICPLLSFLLKSRVEPLELHFPGAKLLLNLTSAKRLGTGREGLRIRFNQSDARALSDSISPPPVLSQQPLRFLNQIPSESTACTIIRVAKIHHLCRSTVTFQASLVNQSQVVFNILRLMFML